MLFNSFEFIVFFIVIVFLYFSIPYKHRWLLLLLGSYYFYMSWKPEYGIIMLFATAVNYFCGRLIGRANSQKKKKIYLSASLISTLSVLFAFKYFNFFNELTRTALAQFSIKNNVPFFNLLLPVGISFFTFQALSYAIDVYRGEQKPEKHFGYFALYISFFPQLVAGPIERSTNLLPQLTERKNDFNFHRAADGVKLMMWGFFKKIVIADRLALYVNQVYNNPHDYFGLTLVIATYFFAFQIYCDFSGYSDIASGSAKIMGYDLMKNFNRPYFSKTIAEFWRRWHISLSTWFKDYLYISLGGNRVDSLKKSFNLLFVFLVTGLWHGANLTFVAWGFLHGLYIFASRKLGSAKKKLLDFLNIDGTNFFLRIFQMFVTFNLVSFSWIFFRANNISDAFYIISHLFDKLSVFKGVALFGRYDFMVAISSVIFLLTVQSIQSRGQIRELLNNKSIFLRWFCYYLIFLGILFFAVDQGNQFIYFQF
ncbi:MAG: MBOAT family O-acyltransferase [bacterium]|nr:MBOAT family O-acyltransferase [bacterium]